MNRFKLFLEYFLILMMVAVMVAMSVGGVVAVIIALCEGSLTLGFYGGMAIAGGIALTAAILAVVE